jgi:hypothetical protein
MTFPWPSFARRALLLHRARRALERGDCARCFDALSDPCLALSSRARELRAAALELACREARRLASEGAVACVEELVERLSAEDPARASATRRELGLPARSASRMRGILDRLRAAPGVGFARAPAIGVLAPRARIEPVAAIDARAGAAQPECVRFHLAVDDGGEFLVAGGRSLVLGHLRSSAANLPFLADVEASHVRFAYSESFHSGTHWTIERLDAREVSIDGRPLETGPRVLHDGERVQLAPNLALLFRQPDATSGSALLDLAANAECQGARRIVLLAPGAAGRVRIGSKRNRHVPVADLAHEIVIEWLERELRVSCAGGVRLAGAPREGADASSLALPWPPTAGYQIVLGARADRRPPFGIHIRPAESPPFAGASR